MYQTKNIITPARTSVSKILLLVVVGILVLAGCVKIDSTTNISSNNEISGAFYMGIDLSALQGLSNSFGDSKTKSSESDPAVIENQIKQQVEKQKNEGVFPKNVDVAYKKDGKYVGIELTFNNMPLSEYQNFVEKTKKTASNNTTSSQMGGLNNSSLNIPNITQNEKDFTYTYNTKGLNAAGNSSSNSMDLSQLMPNLTPVVNLKVTFPGKVKSSNGTVDGNMVTWDYGQIKSLNGQPATATGSSSGSSSLFLFAGLGLIVIIILIIAGLAIFFVSRKKKVAPVPAVATEATAGTSPYGSVPVAEASPTTESAPAEIPKVDTNPDIPTKNLGE